MKSLSLVIAAATLAAVVATDDEDSYSKAHHFRTNEILSGLNKVIGSIQPRYCNNFTGLPLGKNFEMRFAGFSGVIKPLPDKEEISSEGGESRSVIENKLEKLGYVNENGSYYKFHEEGADWWTANRTCEEEGAHLVVINSEEEAQLLADIFAKHTNLKNDYRNKVFIGVNDLEEEGLFVTVLGDELSSAGYAKWRSGNPDDWKAVNKNGEDCVEMGRDKLFNDIHCNAKLAFVCES